MKSDLSLPTPSSDWALFLDVDGTLIEIADRPLAVRVEPRVVAMLDSVARALGGAVALVSGRPIAELDRLFAPLRLPAAGLHGLERRDAARREWRRTTRDPALDGIVAEFERFAGQHPGAIVEDKGSTVALHTRLAPLAEAAAERLADDIVTRHGHRLVRQRGKMVIELRPPGPDKGTVVEEFLAEPPFARRVPVFVGDDATDEAGFEAVNRHHGHAVRVGPAAPTRARWHVATVPALIEWLGALAAADAVKAGSFPEAGAG